MKTILITGSTDGIGLAAAKLFIENKHKVIIHGRNEEKLNRVKTALMTSNPEAVIDSIVADLSDMNAVETMIKEIKASYEKIDVLVNNAGIYMARETVTPAGLELRFMVNTIAPYLLTRDLLGLMDGGGRVVNLSSAAQAPVQIEGIKKATSISDSESYAQSKLALTMWSFEMADSLKDRDNTPAIIAINPKSFLGSKMVHEAYGTKGYDINIGADIIYRAAISEEFNHASGKYFDNDSEQFANPHPDALNPEKRRLLVKTLDEILSL